MASIFNIQNWQPSTFYKKWSIVINNFIYYYANQEYISSSSFNSDFNNLLWGGVTTYNSVIKPNFLWLPSYSSPINPKLNIKKIQFGDGYVQRAPDGINTVLMDCDLSFDDRSELESAAICQFLASKGGVQSFVYSLPPPFNQTKLFICENFSCVPINQDRFNIKARFEESIV